MKKEAYLKGFEEELEKTGILGIGGTSTCVCPKCGHTQAHAKGIPCNKTKCSKCESQMQGKNMPHPLGKGGK